MPTIYTGAHALRPLDYDPTPGILDFKPEELTKIITGAYAQLEQYIYPRPEQAEQSSQVTTQEPVA